MSRETPDIEYPCRWSYRVVGRPEAALRALISEVCGEDEHEIRSVRPSREGTYVSIHVWMTARDEAHRTAVYRALAAHESVRLVL